MARCYDGIDRLEPSYTVQIGLDGKRYAVFSDEFSRWDYDRQCPEKFAGCRLACFGSYDNAYELSERE